VIKIETSKFEQTGTKTIFENPMEVKSFEGWLPHRKPMVWVSSVLWSSETSGECTVNLKDFPLACSYGQLRQSSMIEILAQSFGYVMAHYHCNSKSHLTGFKTTFVVGYRSMKFSSHQVNDEEILKIKVSKEREISPITFIKGTLTSFKKDHIYCEGQLNLFSEV
jgi:predicted hotdog family 3-hydroxylacyl-ACP dehydratase